MTDAITTRLRAARIAEVGDVVVGHALRFLPRGNAAEAGARVVGDDDFIAAESGTSRVNVLLISCSYNQSAYRMRDSTPRNGKPSVTTGRKATGPRRPEGLTDSGAIERRCTAVVNSIHTNIGAMTGLRQLSSTRDDLDDNLSKIATGNKINSPKDDAATLAIAQQLLAEFHGTEAVRDGLDRASATVDVALAAGREISDTLIEMKNLAVQANQEGLDQSSRNALNAAFNELKAQVATINESAAFAGVNLIEAGAADQQVLSSEAGARIAVAAQDLSSAGLGLDGLSLDSLGNAATSFGALDAAITEASAKLANLGSSGQRLDNHNTLIGRQNDTLRAGIGNLIDANLADESARLQANQVKEALSVVALGIANAAPGRILALFSQGG